MFEADLTITEIGVDLTDLKRRLVGRELEIFQSAAQQMLKDTEAVWTGWKYKGRPANAARNVSLAAWKQELQITEGVRTITLINEARDWRTRRKAYAGYVKRRKGEPEEWTVIRDILMVENLPDLIRDLIQAVHETAAENEPRKTLRANTTPTDYQSVNFDI